MAKKVLSSKCYQSNLRDFYKNSGKRGRKKTNFKGAGRSSNTSTLLLRGIIPGNVPDRKKSAYFIFIYM